MAYINDNGYDNGLTWVGTTGSRLDICSSEPATYAAATTSASLGNKTSYSIGAAENNSPDGRKVVGGAITDGTVTDTGTATHWAITDASSVLVATGALDSSQAVTSGNDFTLDAIDIYIRDAS